MENIDKFKKLLKMVEEENYCSTYGAKCGLHIHYSRSALGFNSKEVRMLKQLGYTDNAIAELDDLKSKQTIENIICIMETFKDEMIKVSGRKPEQLSRWCKFQTQNGTELRVIKNTAKHTGVKGGDRYRVVNLTNDKTVEIRINRGTLMWESFNTKIHLMYNVVYLARYGDGLIAFKNLIHVSKYDEVKEMMVDYIENLNYGDRKFRIIDVRKKIRLSADNEFRVDNVNFIGKKYLR